MRKIWKISVYLLFFLMLTVPFASNIWIEKTTKDQMFDDVNAIPKIKVGIVLGTSQLLKNGTKNLYFEYRVDAAEKLFKSKKVKYLILSGDNRTNEYNEPKDMYNALILKGIPDTCLILDYAGLRTFDSMVRCKEIFGQDSIIIISQKFHNARALFISNKIGLKAYAFNAKKVTTQQTKKIRIREFFSRTKCILDLYILKTQPMHLRKKIKIK